MFALKVQIFFNVWSCLCRVCRKVFSFFGIYWVFFLFVRCKFEFSLSRIVNQAFFGLSRVFEKNFMFLKNQVFLVCYEVSSFFISSGEIFWKLKIFFDVLPGRTTYILHDLFKVWAEKRGVFVYYVVWKISLLTLRNTNYRFPLNIFYKWEMHVTDNVFWFNVYILENSDKVTTSTVWSLRTTTHKPHT